MNIIWYGQSCFKIQSKDTVLITDPFDKEIGLKPPFGAADIVTISHNHLSHNNFEVIKANPFIVDSAGEYEVKKIVIRGTDSFHDEKEGAERGGNVIYTIEMEGIRMCHLGDLGQTSLTDEQLSRIGQVDILFVPIGGITTIDWKMAEKIIEQIEARMVIPMHYKISGLKNAAAKLDTAEKFCKEHGINPKETVDKFSIKKKDLPTEEARTILMSIE